MQLPRRTFLESGAAALAATTPPIRAALITEPAGDHLEHYFRTALCEGVAEFAIADPTGETFAAAKKATGGKPVTEFRDAAQMMGTFHPHLAVISRVPRTMPEAIELAVAGGAHVVVEKPGCATLPAFRRAAERGKAAGREVMLAMASRLYPEAEQIRSLVRAGRFGKLYSVDMQWIADQTRLKSPAYHRSWKSSRALGGGGKLIFHGIHYLDLIASLTGDSIADVAAFCRNVGGQPIEVEDAAVVAMTFRGGMVGTLNTGYYLDRGYANRIALWGEHGWFRFEPHAAPVTLTWQSTAAGAPPGVQEVRPAAKANVYQLMLQAAVDFARGIRPPFITSAESLAALETVFAAYQSAATGKSSLRQ